MHYLLIACAAAIAPLAAAQVQHTHQEVWSGGASAHHPTIGTVEGMTTVAWPAVIGWWLGGGWPSVALESRTVVDFVVPPDSSGAAVQFGFESYLHLNNHWDHGGPAYFDNDELVTAWTPGGTQGQPVHWESTREIAGGPALGEAAMRSTNGLQPIRVVSQIGVAGLPSSPHFDAWYVDSSGAQVGLGATIDVETTVTASWAFDPPAITHWDSGDVGCGSTPNATGLTGRLEIGGSPDLVDDSMFVSAWNLPPSCWGILVQADSFGGPTTSTSLCLSAATTSPVRVRVVQANPSGEIAFRHPAAQFLHVSIPGLWRTYFQLWHRDATPAGSNVTNAYRVRYEPL